MARHLPAPPGDRDDAADRADRPAGRAPRRAGGMDRRDPGAGRVRPRARHASAGGGAGARFRARRGRSDRSPDPRGFPALEPHAPAGRERRERDPALRPLLAAAGAARPAAPLPAARGAPPDRPLRPGHGGRAVDSARRGDGCRRSDRRPGRPAAFAVVRGAPRRCDHARNQPACRRRCRLAAQLRCGDRDHALGQASRLAVLGRGAKGVGTRGARRGFRRDDGGNRGHGPA